MGKSVSMELNAPEYRVNKEELAGFAEPDRKMPGVPITKHLLRTLVAAKYPHGLDARDGRVWGRILDSIWDAEPEPDIAFPSIGANIIELDEHDFTWLYKIVNDEDLRLPQGLQHWRFSLVAYMDELKDALKTRPLVTAAAESEH